MHLLEDLLAAGEQLQCHSLITFCKDKLGTLEARIVVHRWRDVQAANAKGRCWLVLDGMVLDVTDWLSEHPGGSNIIPAQALNLDCSRFFEVYHASRESFLYLKEFYIGEVSALDVGDVPVPERPSPDFVSQLRGFTSWRISNRDERGLQKLLTGKNIARRENSAATKVQQCALTGYRHMPVFHVPALPVYRSVS